MKRPQEGREGAKRRSLGFAAKFLQAMEADGKVAQGDHVRERWVFSSLGIHRSRPASEVCKKAPIALWEFLPYRSCKLC